MLLIFGITPTNFICNEHCHAGMFSTKSVAVKKSRNTLQKTLIFRTFTLQQKQNERKVPNSKYPTGPVDLPRWSLVAQKQIQLR